MRGLCAGHGKRAIGKGPFRPADFINRSYWGGLRSIRRGWLTSIVGLLMIDASYRASIMPVYAYISAGLALRR